MELPKFHETFNPILEVLSDGENHRSRDVALKVRDNEYSDYPEELLSQQTSTGANRIIDRIWWGISYLKMANLVNSPSRGVVKITEKGMKIHLSKIDITLDFIKNDPDFIAHRKAAQDRKAKPDIKNISDDSDETPNDLIDRGVSSIEDQVKGELLEKTKNMDPYKFEELILKLLRNMGYGADDDDLKTTPKSGDGGVDGIINEDKLGLSKIYIQAKRFSENKVREKDMRNFIGAMSGDTLKGIFVTTSSFDTAAEKKAKDAHHNIILIDGAKLVDLMYQYGVGVQIKEIFEIKSVDEDFFEGN